MDTNFLEPRLVGEEVNDPETHYPDQPADENSETVYLRLCWAVLLAGIFILPLFFLPWTTSVLEFNKQMLLIGLSGAALILWLLHVVVSGRLSWRPNPVDAAILSVLAASALATLFSLTRFKSLFGLAGSLSESLVVILGLSVFYFACVHSFQDKGRSAKTAMIMSLCLALLFGVLQLFGFHMFKYLNISVLKFAEADAFNTVGSVNSMGLLGALALPLFYRFKDANKIYSSIGKIGSFLALVLLVILNWWALWVVAIAGMACLIAMESVSAKYRNNETSNENTRFRLARFIFPMTVIVLGVFLMIVNFNLAALKANLPIEVAPSFGLSGDVVTEVLKKSPAFGYGPENFSIAFDRFGASNLANTTLSSVKFFDSTSQVMNFAVSGGVVLLVAIAFLLWTLGRGIFKYLNIETLKHDDAGVVSALVALIAGIFLYPFNLTLMFMFYLLIALIVLALWGDESRVLDVEERASTSLVSSLGFIGGLILVLVGSYFGATIYVSDLKYANALTGDSSEEAVRLLVEAINWNGNDDRYYRAASQVALNLMAEELNKKPAAEDRTAKVQNYISSAINLARRATEVGPKEANNWANLGAVYQNLLGFVDGVEKLAEDAYLRAADLRPGDASYFSQVGSTYLASADLSRRLAGGANGARFQAAVGPALDKAEENFKKAVEISNNFGLAIYNLGIVYDRQGKINEAIGQLEKIMPFNSNQPGLAFELGLLYYRVGQKDKSFNELQRAVLLSPDFANARWYLALIYEERQDFASAIEQLEKILAVEANKDNQEVQAKLTQLKNGKKTIPPKKVIDQKPL